MSLEDLERKIYNQESAPGMERPSGVGLEALEKSEEKSETKEKVLAKKEVEKKEESKIPDMWGDLSALPKISEQKKSHVRWGVWIASVFGFLFVGGVVFAILFPNLLQKNTTVNISVGMTVPESVYVGAQFPVKVSVGNIGTEEIKNLTVSLSGDEGLVCKKNLASLDVSENFIDAIAESDSREETFECVPVGDVRTTHAMQAVVSYADFTGTVREEITKTVYIKDYGIELRAKNIENVVNGVPASLDFTYKNISGISFKNLKADFLYPSKFQISSSSVPQESEKRFSLGGLNFEAGKTISFEGVFSENKEIRLTIPLVIKETIGNQEYEVARTPISVGIIKSPIEISVLPTNGSSIQPGDIAQYEIKYTNTSGVSLADVIFEAELSGEMFDFSSTRAQATIDAMGKKIVWTASNNEQLKLLKDGAEGRLIFSVMAKKDFQVTKSDDINFSLQTHVRATSPTVPSYVKGQKTEVNIDHALKVSGKHIFEAEVYANDASAKLPVYGASNKVILPPKVGESNEYSLHLRARSIGSGIEEGVMTVRLGPGVSCGTFIKTNATVNPECNARTQEIIWKFGEISGNVGVSGIDSLEAVVQIVATPGINAKGSSQILTSDISYKGIDAFTKKSFEGSVSDLSTYSLKDISDTKKKTVTQ